MFLYFIVPYVEYSNKSLLRLSFFRYIKTIALQIEITKFFQARYSSGQGEVTPSYATSATKGKIPTLFGNQQMRNDLAIMVGLRLLSGLM